MGPVLPVSEEIHKTKYRLKNESFRESMNRIANALSDNETHFKKFRNMLLDMRFLPAGRVQAGAGTSRDVTLMNCYIAPEIKDDFVNPGGIMDVATKAAATMRMGGGIGYDFSTLRPRGAWIASMDTQSSGPVSFMNIFDAVCKTIACAGHRRGAQMGVLRVDHPDIEEFIHAKQNSTSLTGFNVSVMCTDEFMNAVNRNESFDLKFNGTRYRTINARNLWDQIMRSTWDWAEPGVLFYDNINNNNNLWYCENINVTNPCLHPDTLVETVEGQVKIKDIKEPVKVYTMMPDGKLGISNASASWVSKKNASTIKVKVASGKEVVCTPDHKIYVKNKGWIEAGQLELGDRLYMLVEGKLQEILVMSIEEGPVTDVYDLSVEDTHNFIANYIVVHNCGEQPMGHNSACLLGSLNLVRYIMTDGDKRYLDTKTMADDIPHIVRAMDNVIDVSNYPIEEQRKDQTAKRRMGIGVTGLANALEALGLPYASEDFLVVQDELFDLIKTLCYSASIELAKEKGSFSFFDRDKYLQSGFVKTLRPEIQEGIYKHGIRNSHLLSIAPTGTISLAANNVSSGIEPVFSYKYNRTIQTFDGPVVEEVTDYGYREFGVEGRQTVDLTAQDHLNVLVTAQRHVDSAVSKTCNINPDMPWNDFKDIYMQAWSRGAKGCTTFNPAGKRFGILNTVEETDGEEKACTINPQTGKKECGD